MSLLVNGQSVAVSGWTALGSGVVEGAGPTSFWQVWIGATQALLDGSAEYTLSLPASDGGAATLTDFTTAAGYDKIPGTAPNLRSLRLWRVRYPVADIASGNCVFAEYQSFIAIDYDPAAIPNTETASVIQRFDLAPQTGGTQQTFWFTGSAVFTGLVPAGDYPLPLGEWQPDLDPTRTYCVAITASGDGDLARPRLASNPLCATVTQLSALGAPTASGPGGTAQRAGGAGCSTGGALNLNPDRLLSVVALILVASLSAIRKPRRRA